MRQDTTRRKRLHNRGFNPIEFDGIRRQINYRIHTDAIKDTLIPPSITKECGRLAHTLPLTETPATEAPKHQPPL